MLVSIHCIHAQTDHYHQHSRQIATSDNASVLTGTLALYANPAATLDIQKLWDFSASVSNRYNTDIVDASAVILRRINRSALGIMVGTYGIDGLSRHSLSLSIARSIGTTAYLALQGSFNQLNITEFGQSATSDLTIGYWQKIDNQLVISAYLKHPIQALSDQSLLYGKADVSIGYILSDQLSLYISVDQPWAQRASLRPGIAYAPHNIVTLYMSIDTSPESISFGTSLNLTKGFITDLGINTHPSLGRSLSLSISYSINE